MWRNCAASASAVLSLGLEKRGNIAVASGGLTCTWKWDLGNSWVAIKTFHTCSAQHLKEVKEVSITPARKLCHSQELPDAVEASADMEEVFPNILTFLGVNMTSFQLCLVYDWRYRGDIIQYLALHPQAARPSLVDRIVVATRNTR